MKLIVKNKKAQFEYNLIETYTCGIVLKGTEIKSIRAGKVNINDAYCTFLWDELWIKNMHIAEYQYGNIYNHDPKRDRKLLLNRHELKRLQSKNIEKGMTIIPIKLFINEKGLAKLEIALAKGKKLYDKRENIKKRDIQRDLERGY